MGSLTNPLKGCRLKRWPHGDIYQGFGENKELYKAAIGLDGHNGIDLIQPENTPVVAATSGHVVDIKDTPNGYGKHVRIVSDKQPDGTYLETTYGHLNSVSTGKGEYVHAGNEIGLEGNTGFVISGGTKYWGNAPAGRGVHLHFGLRILKDAKWFTHQIDYLGKSYTIINYNNGLSGHVDPMPYLDPFTKDMKYVIINTEQYLIYEPLKLAFGIADYQELSRLVIRGLVEDPEKWDELPPEYIVYPMVDRSRLQDLFNL